MTTTEIIGISVGMGAVAILFFFVYGFWCFIMQMFSSESKKELKEEISQLSFEGNEMSYKLMTTYESLKIKSEKITDKCEEIRKLKHNLEGMQHHIDGNQHLIAALKAELENEKNNLNPKKLSPKYNPNVTRGSNGRYKSLN